MKAGRDSGCPTSRALYAREVGTFDKDLALLTGKNRPHPGSFQ